MNTEIFAWQDQIVELATLLLTVDMRIFCQKLRGGNKKNCAACNYI